MKSILYSFLFLFVFSSGVFAKYTTPGTGIKWSLDNLVTNSGGAVTFSSDTYFINDTIIISLNDTISIVNDAAVKFGTNTYFSINGVMIVDPPTGVLFTAVSTVTGYNGVRADFSNGSIFRKLTMEYAVSMRLSDCSPLFENCIFRYNNNLASTTFGNGAISLFRSNPTITNCQFVQNQRAAIQGGSNIANAPKIFNCLFDRNDVINANVPQINLGQSGTDTVKILNSQILGGSIMSGGIGFLPIGNLYVLIRGNLIRKNRYGINLQGGASINSVVSYNTIDSNNIQNDPNLGGSGIAFSGGAAGNQQNSIVTGNMFRANLWGITIQTRSKPNLGNLGNADTTDDGKNAFINNTNASTPFTDLYNNSIDTIYAQNNYWNTDDSATIETKIFHKPDNASLGPVYFSGFMTIPVELSNFSATAGKNKVLLQWRTASESNSNYFSIERSDDGRTFYPIGSVTAAGNSSSERLYSFTDNNISLYDRPIFYRLKLVDKDSRFKYSKVVSVKMNEAPKLSVKLYPTILANNEPVNAIITSDKDQMLNIQFLTAEGKLLAATAQQISAGSNNLTINLPSTVTAGIFFIKTALGKYQKTTKLLKQ